MPLSCPVAPPSQRELHKDGGGGGGGVVMRARAARAPKAKSCATSRGTSSATPCAASLTCSSFMSPKGRRGGGARVRVAARRSTTFFPEGLRSPRPLRARPSRVERHCHWACRTNNGLRSFKERATMKKPLVKKPWGRGDWGSLGQATAVMVMHPQRASNVQRARDDEETVDEETPGGVACPLLSVYLACVSFAIWGVLVWPCTLPRTALQY